jgi:PAP2 superfamily
MSAQPETTPETPHAAPKLAGGRVLRDGHVLYWWVEILAILAYYGLYSFVRNANGANPPGAYPHAKQIISLEQHFGIFHEATIQSWALHFKPLIVSANYFYGSLHFIVTIFTGFFLYLKWSDDYPRFRNTLAISTGLALIGFKFYPLMPPRLLDTVGGLHIAHYGFVDTLAKYPTFWSFDSGGMSHLSNQFAAMPSVHICWATFCAFALVPRLRNPVARVLAFLYPFFTLIVIVITANHYFLDAVGGLVIFGLGWVAAGKITRAGRSRPAVVDVT